MKSRLLLGFFLLSVAMLAACGDDSSSANGEATKSPKSSSSRVPSDVEESVDYIWNTVDDRVKCKENRSGMTAYYKPDDALFVCEYDEDSDKWAWTEYVAENDEVATTLTDKRDGQTYKIVKIGDQIWMAQNLNYGDSTKTPSLTDATWCGGGENETKNEGDCSVYGRLYTWAAAVDKREYECGEGHKCGLTGTVQGICPDGWHLPDTTEWNVLFDAVGGKSNAGTMLKTMSGWNDHGDGNGLDAYGFSALPAGYRINGGSFYDAGYYARFWSASEYNSNIAYNVFLNYYYESAFPYDNYKFDAFSVRCLQNSN